MTNRKEGEPELPQHFTEAESYYEELKSNPEWMKANNNKYLAIIGREIVGQSKSFQDLSKEVRETHGYGPIFMPFVTTEQRVVTLRPRIRIIPPQRDSNP